MGGNALKSVETRRYKTDEFENLKTEIIPLIEKLFSTVVYPLKYYYDKESHGDMDLLISTPFSKDSNIKEILIKELGAKEVFKNSNVYSFDYKKLQIDLILIPKNEFEIAKVFYDYNDMGNLIGKLANSLGLKFGPNGLRYIITNGNKTKKYEDLLLSKNVKEIFNVLDLDYNRYEKGFISLNEIFDWIKNSKYFNKNITKLSSLNSSRRHRDKKRKNILKFQEWAEDKDFNDRVKFTRQETIDFINSSFPQLNINSILNKYDILDKEEIEINKKFNGNIIRDNFGLEGIELGNAIVKFKKSLGNDYRKFILSHSTNEILNRFSIIIFNYKKNE